MKHLSEIIKQGYKLTNTIPALAIKRKDDHIEVYAMDRERLFKLIYRGNYDKFVEMFNDDE